MLQYVDLMLTLSPLVITLPGPAYLQPSALASASDATAVDSLNWNDKESYISISGMNCLF